MVTPLTNFVVGMTPAPTTHMSASRTSPLSSSTERTLRVSEPKEGKTQTTPSVPLNSLTTLFILKVTPFFSWSCAWLLDLEHLPFGVSAPTEVPELARREQSPSQPPRCSSPSSPGTRL